jgi:hypothetical protein
LPTCAAPGLCPHPPLRLSRQCSPNRSARTGSPSTCRPTSTRPAHRHLSASHLALPTLRSQHVHRPQPYRATTGLPMQTRRHLMIPTPANRSRTCAGTSSHIYVLTAKLQPYHRSLHACRERNYPSHASLPRIAPSPGPHFQTPTRVHLCRVSPATP